LHLRKVPLKLVYRQMLLMRYMIFAALFLFSFTNLRGQKTAIYTNEDASFREGITLYLNEKFGAAQAVFLKAIQNNPDPNSLVRIESEFYSAVCAVELFNKDAEWLLEKFITDHPESQFVIQSYFHLARYSFRKKKYTKVISWLAGVDPADLKPEEQDEYYFKRGYAYFEGFEYSKAQKDLAEVKDKNSRYGPPANYYHSHILYSLKNYESALIGFRKLSKDLNFGPIVPYYISHILFLQKKYDEVVVYAPPLLKDTANSTRTPEILKIIGESFFHTGDFQEAVPYFEKYRAAAGVLSPAEWYQLGYCYYRSSMHKKAVESFLRSVSKDDSVTQNACYHMGDCYVKLGEKQKANDAFFLAYKNGPDKKIREDALFNYAKLSFELSYNPFNEATKAFETYIAEYPNSTRKDEAYGYLVNVYYNNKNYEAALKSLENMKALPPDLKAAYQKIAYLRGAQLFSDQKYQESIKVFTKSLGYQVDKNYTSQSKYWKASATYLLGEKARNTMFLDDAIAQYKDFLFETGASNTAYFNMVQYDLGYCYFRKSDWQNALTAFRKYLASKPVNENARLSDAYFRTADCYFKTGEHLSAAEYYDKGLEMNLAELDYALFQKGIAYGFAGKGEKKIESLLKLLEMYKGKSTYESVAVYELAKAYSLKDENEKALKQYKRLISEFPNSEYVGASMLQSGGILNKQQKYQEALDQLELVIQKFPKTEIGLEAVMTITEICKNKGDMDCLDRLKKIPWANVSLAKLDSSAFSIAKAAFQSEKYADANRELAKYIQKYPDGIFILDAHFYKAECDYIANDYTAALGGYHYVADHLPNKHGTTAVAKAAWIHYKLQEYDNALKYYAMLESRTENPSQLADARIGQMRCNFKLKYYDAAIQYAQLTLKSDKAPKEIFPECHIIIARSALEKDDLDLAWKEFNEVIKTSQGEKAIESKYCLGLIKFKKGEFKESQKILIDLINSKPGYGYWVGKCFILIADDYVGLNDLHNAKITLKTFIEKSTNAELVAEANAKLAIVLELEQEQQNKNKTKEGEGMRILFEEQQPDSLKDK